MTANHFAAQPETCTLGNGVNFSQILFLPDVSMQRMIPSYEFC